MSKYRLSKKIFIEGIITARTGLHIGGSNVGFAIGGADATVVRNPFNQQPYIPGSSLKGKMRSLIEKLEGKFGPPLDKNVQHGPNTENIEDVSCQIFGTTPENIQKWGDKEYGKYDPGKHARPVSRIIVRDCELTEETYKKLSKIKGEMPLTEVKTEVVIDRITAAATPRQLERVPAGAQFEMRIILNVYDSDNEAVLVNKILEGLCLVQNDYLGGKGSRGSGEVDIKITKPLRFKDKGHYERNQSWQELSIEGVSIPDELKPKTSP
jgi:CRISPR-associated protein Csm3